MWMRLIVSTKYLNWLPLIMIRGEKQLWTSDSLHKLKQWRMCTFLYAHSIAAWVHYLTTNQCSQNVCIFVSYYKTKHLKFFHWWSLKFFGSPRLHFLHRECIFKQEDGTMKVQWEIRLVSYFLHLMMRYGT